MPSGRPHYRLTLGDALEAHNTAIKYGGLPGILNLSLVESAISRPYNGYYRPIRRKAAALIESVCRNHGFADGNKRTCLLLLLLLKVARGEMNFAQIEEWIDERLVKRPVSS